MVTPTSSRLCLTNSCCGNREDIFHSGSGDAIWLDTKLANLKLNLIGLNFNLMVSPSGRT
jgi:hypothetical protein